MGALIKTPKLLYAANVTDTEIQSVAVSEGNFKELRNSAMHISTCQLKHRGEDNLVEQVNKQS